MPTTLLSPLILPDKSDSVSIRVFIYHDKLFLIEVEYPLNEGKPHGTILGQLSYPYHLSTILVFSGRWTLTKNTRNLLLIHEIRLKKWGIKINEEKSVGIALTVSVDFSSGHSQPDSNPANISLHSWHANFTLQPIKVIVTSLRA